MKHLRSAVQWTVTLHCDNAIGDDEMWPDGGTDVEDAFMDAGDDDR
jgi:hypothetical protein